MNLEYSVLNELTDYCNDILNGTINACQKHKWACQRFLNDIKNQKTDNFPYYWDEEKAQKIVKWFSFLRHSKGVLSGKPINLNNWQKFCMCNIYGWYHCDTNYRRFRNAFIFVARKNSKSQMMSGSGLYEMSGFGVNSSECYTLGINRGQAKVVFDECKLMLNSSPLKKKFDFTPKSPYIKHIPSNSFMTALSKDAGKTGEGKNPQWASVDELHVHKDNKMYNVMAKGMVARTAPLIFAITTAGSEYNEENFCYRTYKSCSDIINPDLTDIVNDTYFVMICELEENDDIFDENNWIKANPVLCTYETGINSLRIDLNNVKNDPRELEEFKVKNLNIWSNGGDKTYINLKDWKKCQLDLTQEEFFEKYRGCDCYVGIDISSTNDLTACSFEFPYLEDGIKKYAITAHGFIPSARMLTHIKSENVPYDLWERAGYITKTTTNNGQIIDIRFVIDYIETIKEKYNLNIMNVGYDQHQAGIFVSEMELLGYDTTNIYQAPKYLNDTTINFRDNVLVENVSYAKNGLLDYCISNCILVSNSRGEVKVDKTAYKNKIDLVDAIICSHKLSMLHMQQQDASKYFESEDFTF